MKRLLLPVLILIAAFPLYAQHLRPNSKVLRYTLKDGLSFGIVNSIVQDDKGFMWFATGDGLNRFDGVNFKIYKFEPGNKFSLASNYVQTVFKDSDGTIWVSSRLGLNKFDPKTERFTLYQINKNAGYSMKNNDISNISQSRDGNLWLASSGSGLAYYNKASEKFINYSQRNLPGLSSDFILNIYEDIAGLLWVGTRDSGIDVFNVSHGKILKKVNFPYHTLSSVRINCIYEDHFHNIWIATAKGLMFYKRKENKFYILTANAYHLRSNFFLSLIEDSNGQLLVGLQDGGLYKTDIAATMQKQPGSFVFEEVKGEDNYNLTERSVQTLYQDKDKNIWAGTYGGGVYMISSIRKKFIRFHKKLVDRYGESELRYYGMCLDEEGYLWLGTDGDGIYKSKINGQILKHYIADGRTGSLTNNAILYAYKDSRNNLWFGTYAGGLFLYNPVSDSFINFRHKTSDKKSLGANDVRVIYEDSSRNLWIGTNGGGLSLLNPLSRKIVNYNPDNSNISSNDVRAIVEDEKGNLIIGTYGGGLNYFKRRGNKFLKYFSGSEEKYNISSEVILSLYYDNKANLWIGTEGNGLILYDSRHKTIRKFNEKNGLANNTIYAIKAQNPGIMWVSTNRGLSKIDLSENKIYNYDEGDGLQGGQFNPGSAIYSPKGKFMCFGGTEGWNIFYPESIRQSRYKPQVIITGLQLFGKQKGTGINDNTANHDISETKQIILKPDQSVFSIQYAALNYAYPKQSNFAYKLEGLDKEWNYVKNQTSATYRYLAPGDYTFKVKASNQDNVWFNDYASIKVKVLPPWYKTWWAYLLYISFAGGIVAVYVMYRIRQSRLKYEIRIAHIEAEKEKELHEKKISFFTNISHEFRTPLTLIINPVKELLYNKEKNTDIDNLNIVYRNARRLLSLVDQLLLFRKAESEDDKLKVTKLDLVALCKEVFLCFSHQARMKKIQYEFECQAELIEISGDRQKLEIALFNLISNALKFAPEAGCVSLALIDAPGNVFIQVKDNGPGIAEGTGEKLFNLFYQSHNNTASKGGFGIGLYLVKTFVEKHQGEISYTSNPQTGTCFTITLPKENANSTAISNNEDEIEPSVFLEELVSGNEEMLGLPENADEPEPLEELSSNTKSILIIDDDQHIRQYLRQMFKPEFELLETGNGQDGLTMAGQYLPDVIISDVMMQGMSGIELCSRIKEDPALNHIPVILLTASSSDEVKLKGIECGADDYISKPFEKELLLARVAGILKSRNNLQKYFYNEITLKADNLRISGEYKEFLERCIEIVEQHLDNPDFGIKTLAAEIGMSRSNLYARIKSISGQSPNSFIRFIRLRKAAEIFITTDSTVYETAYQVGIKDPKYFREQFSKLFNMNPSEYVKKYRKPFHNNYNLSKEMIRIKGK